LGEADREWRERVSEDRNKHDSAGKGHKDGLGHKTGGKERAEGKRGMGQYIPDKVRKEIDKREK